VTSPRPRSTLDFLAAALPLLWVGLVIGVSFVATPAKFKAGPMDGALSLAISVVTFAWAHAAEAGFAVALALVLLAVRTGPVRWLLLGVAAIALALEVAWVLPNFQGSPGLIPTMPVLDSRQLHMAFAVMEGAKILALLALAFIVFRDADGRQPAAA
jgi:hypothetical protein